MRARTTKQTRVRLIARGPRFLDAGGMTAPPRSGPAQDSGWAAFAGVVFVLAGSGLILAGLSAINAMLTFAAYPLWSATILLLDLLVCWRSGSGS